MITPLTRRLMLLKASTPDPQVEKEKERTTLRIPSPRRQSLAKSFHRQIKSSLPLVRTPPPLKQQFDKRESKGDTSEARDEIRDSEDMFADDLTCEQEFATSCADDELFAELEACREKVRHEREDWRGAER